MSDPISDMLTRIRNGGRALLPAIELPHSRIKEGVAKILKSRVMSPKCRWTARRPKKIKIQLKYEGKKSVIEGLKRVSKPGLRKYVGATEIPRVRGGLGVAIVSTSEGADDGRAGAQEKSRRRIALLHLVIILCRELENNRLPFPPK